MGRQLASLLNRLIEERESEELPRSEIISRMGSEADLDDDTVRRILRAEIDCPPPERLRGFARALNVPVSQIEQAARQDGCQMEQFAEVFTTRPWDGSKSRFSLEELLRAVPRAVAAWARQRAEEEGRDITKEDLKLPFREPDGTININGVRAALQAIGGARGQRPDLPESVLRAARAELEQVLEEFRRREQRGARFEELAEVEVFRAGRYPQGTVTEEELEEIVRDYNPRLHEARVNLDHGHKEEFGVVAGLKKVGNKLIALIRGIPESLRALNRECKLTGWSVEIHPRFPETGRKYLVGLAALVNKQPAVKNLAPAKFAGQTINFEYSYSEESMTIDQIKMAVSEALRSAFPFMFTKESDSGCGKKDTGQLNEEKLAKVVEERIAMFREEYEEKAKKLEAAERKRQIAVFYEDLERAGHAIPAWRELGIIEFMESLDSKPIELFSKEKISQLEWFQNFLKELPKVVHFEEIAKNKGQAKRGAIRLAGSSRAPVASGSIELAEKALAYSKEHKVPYSEALRQVSLDSA